MGYVYNPFEEDVKKVVFEGILHKRVTDFAYFVAGSANDCQKQGYKNFNGQLAWIRLNFGAGSYHHDDDLFRAWVDEHFPMPLSFGPSGNEELVVETKLESLRSETEVVPTEWPEEYSYVDQYSVYTWVRYVRETVVPWQTVFRLTSNEPEVL